jgi:hypothetical protein
MKPPYPPPYGWTWTGSGFRKLTPKAFNKRLRRAHNRRLMKRAQLPKAPDIVDNEPTGGLDK